MEVCNLAKAVFLLSVIIGSLDTYIFGFSTFTMLMNILFTVFLVVITNWSCYNQTNNWVAWVIVIFSVLSLATLLYLVLSKKDEFDKQFIEEERNRRIKESALHSQ